MRHGKPYPLPMLPDVDYQRLDDDFSDSIVDLEFGVLENFRYFLEGLKPLLLAENMVQTPELVVAHLCAYLGVLTATCRGTKDVLPMEDPIRVLIIKHANLAYASFNQHPVNSSVKGDAKKRENLSVLREAAPGSIVSQTMRLGRIIMDFMSALGDNRSEYLDFRHQKQQELFCPEDKFFEFLLPMTIEHRDEWRATLRGYSMRYVINQVAIQMGWLIGYFSHLDNKAPEESTYLEYGLPCIELYMEFAVNFFKKTEQKQSEKTETPIPSERESFGLDNPVLRPLLNDLAQLSQKVHAQHAPNITDFQKETAIVDAGIQKAIIELIMEKRAPKVVTMSLYYCWFVLEAPESAIVNQIPGEAVAFKEFITIMQLVKKTLNRLPEPKLSDDIKALNIRSEQLKSFYSMPTDLDEVEPKQAQADTTKVIATLHALIANYINKKYQPVIIANVLFSHWLRVYSLFAGAPESEWQKIDYYFDEILTEVRNYLPTIIK